jgi:hypothetical protein
VLKLNINSLRKKKNEYDPLSKQALNSLYLVKYHGIVGNPSLLHYLHSIFLKKKKKKNHHQNILNFFLYHIIHFLCHIVYFLLLFKTFSHFYTIFSPFYIKHSYLFLPQSTLIILTKEKKKKKKKKDEKEFTEHSHDLAGLAEIRLFVMVSFQASPNLLFPS